MSTPYDSTYRPPFPVLAVVLRSEDGTVGPLAALLDSGADATVVPSHLLEEIAALEGEQATLRSHFGDTRLVQTYLANIEVDGHVLPGVYVVGDDEGDEIILGRDVLNKLPLFLDGPQQQTEVLDEEIANRLRSRRA
jgi:predicted aspartyl protease